MAVEPLPPLELLEQRRQELQLQRDRVGEEAQGGYSSRFTTFKGLS